MLFLETGSPAKSLSTKTVTLSTCFCLRYLSAALGFPTRYRAARFHETKSNSRGSLIPWAKCFAVSATSNLSWARYESFMQADLYRVASSFFRIGLRVPSNNSLSCSFSQGALAASVFVLHLDSLMMSGACLIVFLAASVSVSVSVSGSAPVGLWYLRLRPRLLPRLWFITPKTQN